MLAFHVGVFHGKEVAGRGVSYLISFLFDLFFDFMLLFFYRPAPPTTVLTLVVIRFLGSFDC